MCLHGYSVSLCSVCGVCLWDVCIVILFQYKHMDPGKLVIMHTEQHMYTCQDLLTGMSYNIFDKTPVLSLLTGVTRRLALFCFALFCSCVAHNKLLSYMLLTVCNTVIIELHKSFKELYIYANANWIFMYMEKLWYSNYQNIDKSRQGMTRQDKTRRGSTQTIRCLWVEKNTVYACWRITHLQYHNM